MPTRLISDGLLTSPSLRICSTRAQDGFHRFIVLADDFGCFEADPLLLVRRGWPYRPDVTEGHVRSWLVEYAMAGMVTIWDHAGRWFAHLTGWWKIQRHRVEYSEKSPKGSKRKTPRPPEKQGDLVRFSEGASPASAAPVFTFPGGKHDQASMQFDSENVLQFASPAGLPGDFPDTQSQSQVQQEGREARALFADQGTMRATPTELGVSRSVRSEQTPTTNPESPEAFDPEPKSVVGIGLVSAAFEKHLGYLLAGKQYLEVRSWIGRGVPPERFVEAFDVLFALHSHERPRAVWPALLAMIRDTPAQEPLRWQSSPGTAKPPPVNTTWARAKAEAGYSAGDQSDHPADVRLQLAPKVDP